MDAFQQELAEAMRAAQLGEVPQPGDQFANMLDPNGGGAKQPQASKPHGMDQFTHEQIMDMYARIQKGEIPHELQTMAGNQYNDENGNPIVDEEGGCVIQPKAGFVVKTKDLKDQSKVFVNFTYHDIIEGFEEKSIPKEEAEKAGASERGLRIPLSLGTVREDSDKKGDPVQVYDFIWNTDTVKNAQKDAGFRQIMVELAFTYVKQKFDRDLDARFSIPKIKYKGDTIQYQRVRAKKAPKIQEVPMTEEEKKVLEQRALEEERRREALREKEPQWKLYCIMDKRLNKDFGNQEYLQKLIKDSFDTDCVGDDKDRWAQLLETFSLKQQFDVFEEYDGLNASETEGLLMVITLPLLSRGHAIQCHLLSDSYLQVQVPNLYYCALGLPIKIDNQDIKVYFDCKIRRLFIHMSKKVEQLVEIVAPEPEEPEKQTNNLEDDVIEIDTDDHFGRDKTGKVQAPEAPEAKKIDTADLEDDLLYDLC